MFDWLPVRLAPSSNGPQFDWLTVRQAPCSTSPQFYQCPVRPAPSSTGPPCSLLPEAVSARFHLCSLVRTSLHWFACLQAGLLACVFVYLLVHLPTACVACVPTSSTCLTANYWILLSGAVFVLHYYRIPVEVHRGYQKQKESIQTWLYIG